ncbi:MAG TPA: hypothetical protein VK178_13250, partial [Opitutaceae bacterium]|nr:hypothetical protein [Opitutaceae bacterium]
MVARSALPRRLLIPLLLAPALLLAEPASDTAVIPPEPPRPNLRGLSPEQQRAAKHRHGELVEAWSNALPPTERERRHAERRALMRAEEKQQIEDRMLSREARQSKLDAFLLSRAWQEAAGHLGLSRAEIERLARDKILIEDRQVTQSFSPYIDPDRPVFITTDSLLNGFHVLLEHSIGELERHRIAPLRHHLEGVIPRVRFAISQLQIPAAEFTAAIHHAEYVV